MLTDTHCHLDSKAFDPDRSAVIERARQAGVSRMLTPGTDLASSARCVELASRNSGVFAAVGIHPTEAGSYDAAALDELRSLARAPQVKAIGEIGLDYYWVSEAEARAQQRRALVAQLELAAELNKPVILHLREQADADHGPCADDLLELLERWLGIAGQQPPGVLHSFSGSLQTAHHALTLGFFIGITGPITYKNAHGRRALVAELPLDRILIETDSPYLAPDPQRGRRNEPAYVAHIADKIAGVQSRTLEEVIAVTGENAARLFSWGETA